jgi:cyclopropane fatty-acyl-phospholipid synthase-like methyltransferase
LIENVDWGKRAQKGFLRSGIDPADRKGYKNYYIDLLQKMALEEVLKLKGDELVLDFGCGSGRIAYWIAPRVKKVVGLEVTPEMIDLAGRYRTAKNVEFMLYDGVHFPVFSYPFDLILSAGVLQIIEKHPFQFGPVCEERWEVLLHRASIRQPEGGQTQPQGIP